MDKITLPARDIVGAMIVSDMTYQSLKHEMCKYVNISSHIVRELIQKGASGTIADLIAWILSIKKYIPKGYNPLKVKISLNVPVLKKSIYAVKPVVPSPKNKGKSWTDKDLRIIYTLYENKTPVDIIAKALDRTESAIRYIIQKKNNSKDDLR